MREYDFRFPGLDPIRDLARIRILRDTLLEIAGGFTEIMPGQLEDLLPGQGLGYIVALPDGYETTRLADRLANLAGAWRLPQPNLVEASQGPRRGYCFFLVPKMANRDASGRRRPLFSPERRAGLRVALKGRLSHPVQRVYGEWLPRESYRQRDSDASLIFIAKWESAKTEEMLELLIRSEIFDGGKECDQEAIYLSIRGIGSYIYEAK